MLPLQTRDLDALEVACSVVFGADPAVVRPSRAGSSSPTRALERSLLHALQRTPCLVGFSGGRDSSALLAVAVKVAREHGLELPVPITARFPALAGTEESDWQNDVVRRLQLDEWIVLEFDDELDLVGPVAQRVMERQGLPYPYNLHLQAPLLEPARGGSFVTGLGGDEAFTPGPRALALAAGRVRPEARDLLRIAVAAAPRAVRRRRLERVAPAGFPWLRPHARAELRRRWVEEELRMPLRWDRRLREWWRSRYLHLTLARMSRLAADACVQLRHPFADAQVIQSLAAEGGWRGFRSREAALERLFGELLPARLPGRATKATFSTALWNRRTCEFVRGLLDGGQLEPLLAAAELHDHVDADALAAHWSHATPAANSFSIVQACWLAARRSR